MTEKPKIRPVYEARELEHKKRPLKGKTRYLHGIKEYHFDKDISSAVKWLKSQIVKHRKEWQPIDYDLMLKLIDRAFPDIEESDKKVMA